MIKNSKHVPCKARNCIIHELLEKQAWYVASNYCLDETQEKMAHTEQLEIESAFE